jgi:hypothetical protein
MIPLTLGTGQILPTRKGSFLLRYMTHGSFLLGERFYADEQSAREFCEANGIRVL